jgi:predicted CXXCH cytochrome family protein
MKTKHVFFVITIAIIGIVFAFPHKMLSPGNLYQAHSDLNNDCFACHKVFLGTPNENCISCHNVAEIGLKKYKKGDSTSVNNKILFHKNLKNQDCISCHSDHKGLNPKLSLKKFNHNLLDVTNRNNCISCHSQPKNKLHSQVTNSCVSCHSTTSWTSTTLFNHDKIKGEIRNNCLACHQTPKDNFHSSSKTNNCISCHSLNKWKPSTFNHNNAFILDKNHNATCATCHTNNDFKTYTCYGCHEHSINNIRGEHIEEGISNFNDCVKCHKSGNEDDIRMNENGVKNYINKELKNENRGEGGDD